MIRFALDTAPTSEPVSLQEAKQHARIRHDRDDAYIEKLITVARRRAESDTGRALIAQQWTATLDRWPSVEPGDGFRRVTLAPHNVASVVSVEVDGVALAAEQYAFAGGELRVAASAPESVAPLGGGIVVTFAAEVAEPSDLEVFKLAICMLVAYWYENREAARSDGAWPAVSFAGYDALIAPFVVLAL